MVVARSKTEYFGRIMEVVYSDPACTFAILRLHDNTTVKGPCDATSLTLGTLIYRFLGKWVDDAKRGPQFVFTTYVVDRPAGRSGTIKYLCETCRGVGPTRAEQLFAKYASNAIIQLRDDPAKVSTDLGWNAEICQEAAEDLKRDKSTQATKIGLHDLFAGRGFSAKLIEQCIRKWGVKAPDMIKRNPFNLLGMPSAGFKRCNKLWEEYQLPPAAMKRQVLAARHLVSLDNNGHTWIKAQDLASKLTEMIPGASPRRCFQVALRARVLAKYKDPDGVLWLTDYERDVCERNIADHVERLNQYPARWPIESVPVSQREGDKLPSEHQYQNLATATRMPVGLLCGSPGTGKSHALAYLLQATIAEYGRSAVAACAPTGKAAVRMTQAMREAGLNLTATTIHTLLQIQKAGYGGDGWGFFHNDSNPLPYRFVVCDEYSMVDAEIVSKLLAAIPDSGHILFVGDVHQLPPVGHGAPLRDMIAAGLPHGELTQVRRNAGRIVHACLRIKNGEEFETSEKIDLETGSPENLKLYQAKTDTQTTEVLESLLQKMTRFDPVRQTQVIVARNQSRKVLNDRLQQLLNPDGLQVKGNPFRVGDKIICLRNSWMSVVVPIGFIGELQTDPRAYQDEMEDDVDDEGRQQPKEIYVANGEIGFVMAASATLTIARFSEADELVKIPMGRSSDDDEDSQDAERGRGSNFDLAYACTCHKLQGSQSPCVIVVGDEQGGRIASREWWYTAISRAAKLCLLIGSKSTIDKQRLKRVVAIRKTFLAERIRENGVRHE